MNKVLKYGLVFSGCLTESKRESSDPYEDYITMRIKNAQLQFTYLEHIRKKDEIKDIIEQKLSKWI